MAVADEPGNALGASPTFAVSRYTFFSTMGPRDRDDLVRLVDRLSAIEAREQGDCSKVAVCRELKDKLQRAMRSGWLSEPAQPARRAVVSAG